MISAKNVLITRRNKANFPLVFIKVYPAIVNATEIVIIVRAEPLDNKNSNSSLCSIRIDYKFGLYFFIFFLRLNNPHKFNALIINIYKLSCINLFIKMKDDFGSQIAIMIFLCIGLLGFFQKGLITGNKWVDVFLLTAQPYAFWIGIMTGIGLIVNFILMIFHPNKQKTRREVHYKIMKAYLHVSILLVYFFILGWFVALSWIGLIIIEFPIGVSLGIVSLVTFIIISIVDNLVNRSLNFRWYNFWRWVQ